MRSRSRRGDYTRSPIIEFLPLGVAFLWDGIGATVGLGDCGTWGLGDLGNTTSRIPYLPTSLSPYFSKSSLSYATPTSQAKLL